MKRLAGCLAAFAVAACFWLQARADQVVIDDYTWHYEITGGEASPAKVVITGVDYDSDVVGEPMLEIPDFIEVGDEQVPVTEIADGAFSGDDAATYAYIPPTVETIGENAFYDCSALQSVDFPGCNIIYGEDYETEGASFENTLAIGSYAFSGCTSLVEIAFPAILAEIGEYAFEDCTALAFVDFDSEYWVWDGSLTIGEGAFAGCTSLEEVYFPEYPCHEEYDEESDEYYLWDGWSLEIGENAFSGCEALGYFYFPAITTYVGAYAFEGCSALKEVVFGSNYDVREGELHIGEYAFAGCESIRYVEFGDRYAEWFEEYDEETDEYNEWFESDWYVTIDEGAFSGCSALEDVYLGDANYDYDKESAFEGTPWGEPFRLIYEDGWLYGYEGVLSPLREYELEIEEDTIGIADDAFEGLEGLTSVYIPGTVEYIGDKAFADCKSLQWVEFSTPERIEEVIDEEGGEYDYYYANGLEIGAYAFAGCEALEEFEAPAHLTNLGEYAFQGCTALQGVYFSSDEEVREGELYIGDFAFAECGNLAGVYFEDRHAEWFEEYDEQTDEYIERCESGWYVSIGECAFLDCHSLEDVYFGVGIAEINRNAFANDGALFSVEFPPTLEYIGSLAFGYCRNLEEVEFLGDPSEIEIAYDAFKYTEYDNNRDFEIVIEDDVVIDHIGRIQDGETLDVVIPDGVVGIKRFAFEDLEGLTSVTIPASVKWIDSWAFSNCGDLEDVVFEGGMDGVSIGSGAFWETPFNEGLDFALTISDGVLTGFVGVDVPEEIVIPDGVKEIAVSAFDFDSYCYGEYDEDAHEWTEWSPLEDVKSITIPATVETIGLYAFWNCSGLESVAVGNPFVEIDGSAFFGCEGLDELTFDYPGYAIDSMTITGYSYRDDDDDEDYEGYLPAGESLTVPLDFSILFTGYEEEYENCEGETVTDYTWMEYVTVKFNWVATTRTIAFDSAGGSAVDSVTILVDDPVTPPADPVRDGYVFAGWEPTLPAVMPATNMTFTAIWDKIAEVAVDAATLGAELPSNTVLVVGKEIGESNIAAITEAVLAAAPKRHGRSLTGLVDGDGNPITASTVMGDGMTIAADWASFNPLDGDSDAKVDTSAAQQYNGYVLDEAGNCVGTILVKVGKPNKKTGQASVSATVQMMGEKKLTFKAESKGKAEISADGATTNVTLVCSKAASDIVIDISQAGVFGKYGAYETVGSRNVSKNKADSYSPWAGVYEVALATKDAEGAGEAFASGYSTVNVSVAAKGKVKVTGTMADGTKINASSQLLVADNGEEACVNVFAPMYSGKKGGIAFVLWLAVDGTASVESVSTWNCANKKAPFSATIECVDVARLAAPAGTLEFSLVGELPEQLSGADVLTDYLPDGVGVTVSGSKLTTAKAGKVKYDRKAKEVVVTGGADNTAALKLTYTAKTGALKGSFTAYTLSGTKLKKVKATLTGAFVDGVGYGSAVIKNVGSFAFELK